MTREQLIPIDVESELERRGNLRAGFVEVIEAKIADSPILLDVEALRPAEAKLPSHGSSEETSAAEPLSEAF
jgi:hypothetical protein